MLRRMHVLVAIALATVTGVAGCGNDSSSPAAPAEDSAPPAAVLDLSASVNASSTPRVALSWSAGSEPDLVCYRVYRADIRDASGSTKRGDARISMAFLDELTSTYFVDTSVSLGASYTYSVTAVDTSGNESLRAVATVIVAMPGDHPDEDPDFVPGSH